MTSSAEPVLGRLWTHEARRLANGSPPDAERLLGSQHIRRDRIDAVVGKRTAVRASAHADERLRSSRAGTTPSMLSTLLALTAPVAPTTAGPTTAFSDVWPSLLTVLAVIAVICVLLIALTYLEPKSATAGRRLNRATRSDPGNVSSRSGGPLP